LNRPTIQLSTHDVNLGKLGKKSKLKGRVSISNIGRGILHISAVQVFNNAIQVGIPKRDIVPGETINMDIVLLSKYLKTAKSLPRVLLITNDAEHVKETINVIYE
jgi:flagella basal body P-ring formation protein FlgA